MTSAANTRDRQVLDTSGYSHRVPETDVYDSHDYESTRPSSAPTRLAEPTTPQEENGIYRFDRSERLDVDRVRAAQLRPAAYEK